MNQISIDVPDSLTSQQIEIIRIGLQEKANEAIEEVFGGSVVSEVFRLLREHREFTGQSTESLMTETERLRIAFGLGTGHLSGDFARSFSLHSSDENERLSEF